MSSFTDTTEHGLERLIRTELTGHACDPPQTVNKGMNTHAIEYNEGVTIIQGKADDYPEYH